MNVDKNRKNKVYFCILGIFSLYFYLAFNTPLTHDDWTWGSSIGLRRLDNWFEDYNGRYMGNFFELFLTRVHWTRFFIMALFATLLVVLANQTKLNLKNGLVLSFLLFISVPVNIFAQTYAWAAGFSNYITSIVFILIYLAIVQNIFETEKPKYKPWLTFAVIPLGITTPLYVEHITLYSLFLSFFVILFVFIRFKQVYALHIAYAVSVIIGAVIMFSNGAYSKILSGTDNYRSIDDTEADVGLFKKIFDVYTEQIYPLLFLNNIILNIVISIFCIILIFKYKDIASRLHILMKNFLLLILVVYPAYKIFVVDIYKISFFNKYTNEFEAFFSLLFYFTILLTVLFFTDQNNIKYRVSLYLISIVLLAAPLVFVHPFGPRNFIAPYSFFVMIAIELSVYIAKNNYLNVIPIKKLVTFASIFITICYIYVFTSIGSVNRERLHHINQKIEAKEDSIIITRLPFEQYLWVSSPSTRGSRSIHQNTFKEFHGIPIETELKVIPHAEWEKRK